MDNTTLPRTRHTLDNWIAAVLDDDGTAIAYRAWHHLDADEQRELAAARRQALRSPDTETEGMVG